MMISSPRRSRLTATGVALFLNVLVLAVLSALMAAGVERTLTARALRTQVGVLADNVGQLIQVRTDNIAKLEAQLSQAQTELGAAKSSVPDLSAPYRFYERGFALGPLTGVEVQSIQWDGSQTQTTVLGDLATETYSLTAKGDSSSCLAFLSRIEAEGAPLLATERVAISAEASSCSFDATVLGISGAAP